MAQPLKNYLRSARKRAGLTQEDLAYLLGGRGAKLVSRYERFEREPRLAAALAFEAALGEPARELFAGTFESTRERVCHRARVMELQMKRNRRSARVARKEATIRRILEQRK